MLFGLLAAASAFAQAPQRLADLLPPGTDLNDPGQRARVVGQARVIEAERKRVALDRAALRGFPHPAQTPSRHRRD